MRLMACLLAATVPLLASGAIVPEDARVERVATGFRFTEGPALGPDRAIYFSDVRGGQVHRFDPATGQTTVFLDDSGGSNGLAFDTQGRLVLCEDRGRRVSRTPVLGEPQPAGEAAAGRLLLADRHEGKRFNSPNDLTLDARDGVYFTDPRYGRQDGRELDVEAVYYVTADGEVTQIIVDLKKPNGIMLSPDGGTLYVADNGAALVIAYDVVGHGRIGNGRIFARPPEGTRGGPDGMTLDRRGNLYAAWHGAATVFIWNPQGELIGQIAVPEQPTNVTFGADGRTLYITGGNSLHRIALNVPQ